MDNYPSTYKHFISIFNNAETLDVLDSMVQRYSQLLRAPYNKGEDRYRRAIDSYEILADLYPESSHKRAKALFQAAYDREYEIRHPVGLDQVPPLYRVPKDELPEDSEQ